MAACWAPFSESARLTHAAQQSCTALGVRGSEQVNMCSCVVTIEKLSMKGMFSPSKIYFFNFIVIHIIS